MNCYYIITTSYIYYIMGVRIMNKKLFTGALTLLFVAMMLSGCVRMPYEGGNFIEMPEEFEQNIEEVEYEEPELEAIIQIEEEIIQLEDEMDVSLAEEEELTQFNIEELEEELPEGVFKKIVVDEKDIIDLTVNAMDPDGNVLMYTFSEPLDEEGKWETKRGDAGEYITEIKVSDGDLETSAKVLLVINSINKIPVMEEIESIVIQEGETITLTPLATDGNEDLVVFSYSGFLTKDTMKVGYETVSCQEGIYDCMQTFATTITASDGFSEITQGVGITVINKNRAPTLEPLEDITVDELGFVEVTPEAIDLDGNELKMDFTAPFGEDGTFQTERGHAGEYTIYVTASDGDLSTSEKFMLIVNSINEDPILAPMNDITVRETETIVLRPGAIDKNNDTIIFEITGWMESQKYETTYDDAGQYVVTIAAKDPYGGVATLDLNIEVRDVNRPPVILSVY